MTGSRLAKGGGPARLAVYATVPSRVTGRSVHAAQEPRTSGEEMR